MLSHLISEISMYIIVTSITAISVARRVLSSSEKQLMCLLICMFWHIRLHFRLSANDCAGFCDTIGSAVFSCEGHLALIWIHHCLKNTRERVRFFQYQVDYHVYIRYELMLTWDKRGTFLILWSVVQLQNDKGRGSSESNVIFW